MIFLDELDVDITRKYKDLDNANSFVEGFKNLVSIQMISLCSFYSDGKLKRRIVVVQESAHEL